MLFNKKFREFTNFTEIARKVFSRNIFQVEYAEETMEFFTVLYNKPIFSEGIKSFWFHEIFSK